MATNGGHRKNEPPWAQVGTTSSNIHFGASTSTNYLYKARDFRYRVFVIPVRPDGIFRGGTFGVF